MRAGTLCLIGAALCLPACGPAPDAGEPAPSTTVAATPAPPSPSPEAIASEETVTLQLDVVPGLQEVELRPATLRRRLESAPPEGLDVSLLPEGAWSFGAAPLTKTESVPFAISADRRVLWLDGDRDSRLEPEERSESGRRVGALHWHERLETVVRREHEGEIHEDRLLLAVAAQVPPGQTAYSRLDSHRAGVLDAGGHAVRVAVVDRTYRGWFSHRGRDRILVDVDGDGRFRTSDDSHERYRLGEPIPVGDLDLVATSFDPLGRTITFERSEKPARRMVPLDVGKPAPELAGTALDGRELRLSAHRGSWVLIDFWATWCGPCRKELPHLKDLKATHPELVILGVSGDRDLVALERFLARDPLPWRQVFDEGAPLRRQWRVQHLPTNYLVAPDGTIAGKNLRGARLEERYRTDVERWRRRVERAGAAADG